MEYDDRDGKGAWIYGDVVVYQYERGLCGVRSLSRNIDIVPLCKYEWIDGFEQGLARVKSDGYTKRYFLYIPRKKQDAGNDDAKKADVQQKDEKAGAQAGDGKDDKSVEGDDGQSTKTSDQSTDTTADGDTKDEDEELGDPIPRNNSKNNVSHESEAVKAMAAQKAKKRGLDKVLEKVEVVNRETIVDSDTGEKYVYTRLSPFDLADADFSKYLMVRKKADPMAAYKPAKWGIIDEEGVEILPCKYDAIWNFLGKGRMTTMVIKDGKAYDFNLATYELTELDLIVRKKPYFKPVKTLRIDKTEK